MEIVLVFFQDREFHFRRGHGDDPSDANGGGGQTWLGG